jgi:4a-hydroxytetrahydrobiopterin dehydratase
MTELVNKQCKPCEGGTPALSSEQVENLLTQVKYWSADRENRAISRTFQFKNFYETTAFVNAVAWIAHREDHHPDLEVGYKLCVVRYTTHAVRGLSENDFICAAKIDALLGA